MQSTLVPAIPPASNALSGRPGNTSAGRFAAGEALRVSRVPPVRLLLHTVRQVVRSRPARSVCRQGSSALLWAVVASVVILATARAAAAGDCLCGTLADEAVAAQAGWRPEWTVQLPFDAGRTRLAHVVASTDLVVGQAEDGSVHAIAATGPRQGCCLWSWPRGIDSLEIDFSPVGAAAVLPPAVGPERVTLALGRTVYGLDATTGGQIYSYLFGPSIATTPVESGKWLYAPAMDGSIVRAPADPLLEDPAAEPADASDPAGIEKRPARRSDGKAPWEPLSLRAGGLVRLQPRPLGDGGVLWITERGGVVALVPVASGWSRSEFEFGSPVVGEAVIRDDTIWAVTEDHDLVRLTADLGKSFRLRRQWRLPLPAPAAEGMLLDGNTLVIPLGADGLAAYDPESGRQRWHIPCRCTLLALGGGRAWVIDAAGFLTAFSLTDGMPIGSACLAGFSLPVRSTQPGRLLLASPQGLLTSLVPASPESAAARARAVPQPAAGDAADPPTDAGEPEDAADDGTATDVPGDRAT